jgi:hypothetical protein
LLPSVTGRSQALQQWPPLGHGLRA